MKEGFQLVKIEPSTDQLDFIGKITKTTSIGGNNFSGNISLVLNRAVKIKSITLKFKGRYHTKHMRNNDLQTIAMAANMLPKLKTKIVEKSLALNGGQHSFSWELVVPNVYPQSFETDRASISYFLELKISMGVGRSFTVEHPITIQRHLVASPRSAVLMNTRIHKYTSPGKLYCEIEVPKVVCAGQVYFPVSIKYACIRDMLIKHISTHLVQSETYKARSQAKTEAEKRFGEPSVLSKITKDLYPTTINHVDPQSSNMDLPPLLLAQSIPEVGITSGVESLLVTVSHQLDVTFDLDNNKLQTRIPILLTTVPKACDNQPIDRVSYPVENMAHQKPLFIETGATERVRTPSLQKRFSDQTIDATLSPSSSTKTAGSNKLAIDTNLANKLQSVSIDGSEEIKSAQMYYMNSPSTSILSPPIEANSGLSPPPRRPRKKTISLEHTTSRRQTRDTMKKISEGDALPTPPSSGRMTEFSQPRKSPLLDNDRASFNEDVRRSSTSSVRHDPSKPLKRSDSCNSSNSRKYPHSVTSHYVSAGLPPLPRSLIPSSELIQKGLQANPLNQDSDNLVHPKDDTLSINM